MKYVWILVVAFVGALAGSFAFYCVMGDTRATQNGSTLSKSNYPLPMKEFCDRVIAEVAQGNAIQALDLIASHSVISEETIQNSRKGWIEGTSQASALFGGLQGCDLLLVESAGQSVYRFSYLVRFKQFAVRLSLTFCGDADSYVVTNYSLTRDLEPLFRVVEQN